MDQDLVMTLTDFLLARIAEDEDAAQYALKYAVGGDDYDHHWRWVHLYKLKDRQLGWSSSHHDGAPNPERVLAECEAKRQIIELRRRKLADGWASGLGNAIKALALPYADHLDYQEGWRP